MAKENEMPDEIKNLKRIWLLPDDPDEPGQYEGWVWSSRDDWAKEFPSLGFIREDLTNLKSQSTPNAEIEELLKKSKEQVCTYEIRHHNIPTEDNRLILEIYKQQVLDLQNLLPKGEKRCPK